MSIFGIGTKKKQRVTERWIEQELSNHGDFYSSRDKAGDLRSLVRELDALSVPDDAEVTVMFALKYARWNKTEHRADIEADD